MGVFYFFVLFHLLNYVDRHLMVRDGLLSRNSRLLPVASCPTTPLDGRPDSMMSAGKDVYSIS